MEVCEMEKHTCDALDLDKQICFPFYAASREIIKLYRPFLDPLDLTYTQYITMMVLWKEQKINVKELGKRLFLDSGTLTPVLKSLESKGLITRQRSQKDERVLIAELTAKGEDLKEEAKHIPYEMSKLVNLTYEEAQIAYKLVYKLLAPYKK
jgi:DNA-binding MarR family transcriptional regulator